MNTMIKRHDLTSILIHWVNAACWLILFFTGVGLIKNEDLNPFGAWYPEAIRSMLGGGSALLAIHLVVGFLWLIVFGLYLATKLGCVRCFIKEIFSISLSRDITWMVRKMALMTVGEKGLKAIGQPTDLPDQGYYNMGQKAFAQASVVGGVVIAVTGVIIFLSDIIIPAGMTWLVGWSVALHYLAVGLVFAGLLVHIYMAAISPDERPGLISMLTGTVPADYAKHHHKLWYDEVAGELKASPEADRLQ